MNDSIRIKLSLGLIAVAVVHAILLGVVFNALHQEPAVVPSIDNSWPPPSVQPSSPTVGSVEKLTQPQSVNLQAQGEIKQQSAACAPNCPPSRVVSPAVVVLLQVQPAAVTTPSFVNNTSQLLPHPLLPHHRPRRAINWLSSWEAMQPVELSCNGLAPTRNCYRLRELRVPGLHR